MLVTKEKSRNLMSVLNGGSSFIESQTFFKENELVKLFVFTVVL